MPQESHLSPSIERGPGEKAAAFEMKFLISEALARRVEAWAVERLECDPFGDPAHDGAYRTTTLYLDTERFDILHRAPGFRRRKYRLRRYGSESRVYLECKSRRGDRVRKRRSHAPLDEVALLNGHGAASGDGSSDAAGHSNGNGAAIADWSGQWFRSEIVARALRPVCRVTYHRRAFVKATPAGPLRLTFDRRVCGEPAQGWDLAPVEGGHAILADDVICEMKFRDSMPDLFKQAIVALGLPLGAVSKYRRVMAAAGFSNGSGPNA